MTSWWFQSRTRSAHDTKVTMHFVKLFFPLIPCPLVKYILVCTLEAPLGKRYTTHVFILFTRPVCWNGWISDNYYSLKPLCSGMGEVVPARTSPTLLPPSPRTELSCLGLQLVTLHHICRLMQWACDVYTPSQLCLSLVINMDCLRYCAIPQI